MKTAISVPDELFRAIEKEAERLGTSRSELFARAARAYLEQRSPEAIRESYDLAYGGDEDRPDERGARRRAARRALMGVEW